MAKEIGCFQDNPAQPDFEKLLSKSKVSKDKCLELAFENHYIYAGLQDGGYCWGANHKIGKYGVSNLCNMKFPNDDQIYGGKFANTAFKFPFSKDKFCGADMKFDEMKPTGETNWGNGGILTNPSGDGE